MAKGLSAMSGKVLAVVMGVLLVGMGLWTSKTLDLSKTVLMLTAALVLGLEYGWKNLKKIDSVNDYVTIAIIGTLVVVGLLGLTPLTVPSIIGQASNYLLVLTGGWIALEAFY